MGRMMVSICRIARWSMKGISPQPRWAVLLGALLLAAGLPAGARAAVNSRSADGQPAPAVRSGSGSSGAQTPGACDRQMVYQLRRSTRAQSGEDC
jgi:hypothetical protein